MEDLIDHANRLNQNLIEIAAREASEAERNQAILNARAEQSNERAHQFIDIMKQYQIPTVDLCGFNTLNQGTDTQRVIHRVVIGKGWIVYNYYPAVNNDDVEQFGLIILEDAESYNFNIAPPQGYSVDMNKEVYLDGHFVLSSTSARPESIEKSKAFAPYCDELSGIDNLSYALIRYGIVK